MASAAATTTATSPAQRAPSRSTGVGKGTAPEPREPALVRNVVLVGRSGAGKTTLVEALLAASGTISRAGRVEDGTTVCDSGDLEHRQHRSIALALAPLVHEGVKVNLLDAPGHADFVAELRAGLRAADAALFVVSAVDGVDERTEQLWRECAAAGLPRAVAVTQLDRPRADVPGVVESVRAAFGDGVHEAELPLGDGLLDLLTLKVHDGQHVEREASADERAASAALREELVESVIAESEDEALLDHYLGGDELDPQALAVDLEKAVAGGHFHPVVPVCATSGTGVPELLDLLVRAFPSPLEHPLLPVTRPDGAPAGSFRCDPDGPLVAQVVRTGTDPYLGRVCLVRVFSGTLRPDLPVHLSGHAASRPEHDDDARVGPLSSPLGALSRPVSSCPAGDLCTVARLAGAQTGDTLSAVDRPLLVAAWELPEPQLPVAVEATTPADEDKLDEALARVAVEDPSVRVHRDAETGQVVLWCLGDAHADVLLDRLGVPVQRPEVRVALRETLAAPTTVTGRLVKQSGGHGQYAVVVLELTPLPTGSGITFESRVVGGAVPTTYVGSVDKGVRQQAERGVHDGRPLVDVAVALVDGKAHSVDSSDAAFTSAGALAVREAVAAVGTTVLEPVSALEIEVPTWSVGAVLSDLSGRRTRVTGSTAATGPDGAPDQEVTVVHAETPDVELLRYAVQLRALTHGAGTFRRRPLRHEPAPPAAHGGR